MTNSRTRFHVVPLLIAVLVIGAFAFLLRTRSQTPSTPKPAIVEIVNRGLKPEDEQTFRTRLADLQAERAALEAEGKTDITLLLRIGVQHYILGEVALAAETYRAILAVNPQDAAALENLGQALSEMGDYVGALEAWQQAVNVLPMESTYLRLIELIEDRLPEHQVRIPAILEHGIANLGQTYGFLIKLGDWYASQGDYVRAVSHYEVALQLNENGSSRETLEQYRQKLREQEAAQLQQQNP